MTDKTDNRFTPEERAVIIKAMDFATNDFLFVAKMSVEESAVMDSAMRKLKDVTPIVGELITINIEVSEKKRYENLITALRNKLFEIRNICTTYRGRGFTRIQEIIDHDTTSAQRRMEMIERLRQIKQK